MKGEKKEEFLVVVMTCMRIKTRTCAIWRGKGGNNKTTRKKMIENSPISSSSSASTSTKHRSP